MPGISVSRIPIPFRKAGINWSSYWATLISATVENDAPTHVVLTFPTAATLDETNFSLPGFTIASASWTGPVLTLVTSKPVLYWHQNLTLTLVNTGDTTIITNNVAIANSVVLWADKGDGSATYVTKDGSDLVSAWKDLSGAGHDLLQSTGANQPKWESDGVLFDGVATSLKTAAFTYNQPEFIYMVVKQLTWTLYDRLIDGASNDTMLIYQTPTTPKLSCFAGELDGTIDTSLNEFIIIRALFNSTNSKFGINDNVVGSLNFGTRNAGGITLGRRGASNELFAHMKVAELICDSDTDAHTESAIYSYLKNKYGPGWPIGNLSRYTFLFNESIIF